MEKIANLVRQYREPSTVTASRYRRIAKAMLEGGKRIASRGGYAEARAALVHHAVTTAKAILTTPQARRTATMQQALADADRFLSLFPPGGGAGHVYSGPRSTKAERKKRIRGLGPDWRTDLFAIVEDSFAMDAPAIAILELSGLRRAELAKGVKVERYRQGLRLQIEGAKVNAVRGQPLRDMVASLTHPRAKWLADALALAVGETAVVRITKHRLNYVVARAARQAFPTLPDSLLPTPKTYRDQLSADLKRMCPPLDVATVLGHASERSQNAYAGSRDARGPVSWVVAASTSRAIKPVGSPNRFRRPIVSSGGGQQPVPFFRKGVA